MGVGTKHTLGSIVIAGTGTATFREIDDQTLDPTVDLFVGTASGVPQPTFAGVMSIMPRLNFTTFELARVLDITGTTGIALPTSTTYTTATAYFSKITEGGLRAGASAHISTTINEGILVPQSITVSQNQPARLNCALIATYNATNNPFVYATGVSLPTAAVFDQAYTLGPISINGTTFTGVQSLTYDFGLDIDVQNSSGEVYPTFCGILRQQPFFDFDTNEAPDWVTNVGLTGTAQGATDSVFYLSQIDKNGTRTAGSTHISFTVDDGMIIQRPASASNNNPAMFSFRFTPTFDNSNAIVVYSKTAALP